MDKLIKNYILDKVFNLIKECNSLEELRKIRNGKYNLSDSLFISFAETSYYSDSRQIIITRNEVSYYFDEINFLFYQNKISKIISLLDKKIEKLENLEKEKIFLQ